MLRFLSSFLFTYGCFVSLLVCTSSALFASELKPTQVPGHQAVRSGEHPRLLFRKSYLSVIKRRAKTPEGKPILAQLKKALGGGEAMPEHVSTVRIPYHETANLPMGGFSISHAAGFGMLYQLTGEQEYADLGRSIVTELISSPFGNT